MIKEEIYKDFYESVKKSYINYLLYGDRSDKKLKPLHGWVGETLSKITHNKYNIFYTNGCEVKTDGGYYTKKVDIAITEKDAQIKKRDKKTLYIENIKGAVSIKFITSNFKQNANNYFEVLLGECANLRDKNIYFFHFIVFRDKIPYFRKNELLKNWEILNDRNLQKYIKLFERRNHLYVPNAIGIEIVNIFPIVEEIYNRKPKFSINEINDVENKKGKITIKNGIDNIQISKEVKDYINKNFSLPNFLLEIQKLLG